MFYNHAWQYDGEYFKFPLRAVVPKPLQKPHPPLWVACSQLDTIKYAAHRGMGALSFKFEDLKAANAWVNAYYNTFTRNQEKLTDYQSNPNIAVVGGFMCCETDEEAWEKADGWTFFQFAWQLYNKEGPFEPGTVNFWDKYQEWKSAVLGGELELEDIDTDPFNFKTRQTPSQKSSKAEIKADMIAGAVGRPGSLPTK
jgi:alkanesulfonate monooxygenase SsuD/methylene tetrahydromethanopterin reductase-like flavin-dependent oxidoreductase (luciferase family)